MAFISDVVKSGDLVLDKFNLVAAGCGTGKTYWVLHNLLKEFPDIEPYEVAFVTSRSITKEQQARNRGTTKFRNNDTTVLQFWNGLEDDENLLLEYGVQLMTYDQIIKTIKSDAQGGREVLKNLKIVIFDECHVLFSDSFISGMDTLKLWLREVIYGARKHMIGLSATTNIIEFCNSAWGVPINYINKEVIPGY